MGWGRGDPPQESVDDNGEGQEYHGGSAASLGNACEGLYGDLVQDRPLWTIPQIRILPVRDQARQPPPWAGSLGTSRIARMAGGGGARHYQQQGEEGQVVTAADGPIDADVCGTALGSPVS